MLPTTFPVVTALSVDDGRGNTSQTTFCYAGGYYDRFERDFRGFYHSRSIGPPPPAGVAALVADTWFHQGNGLGDEYGRTGYLKGQPIRNLTADTTGHVYSEQRFEYATNNIPMGFPPAFVPLITITEDTEGDSGIKTVLREFAYDDFGNIVHEFVDRPGTTEDKTIDRLFLTNTTAWLSVPLKESVFKGSLATPPNLVREDSYCYDNIADCFSPNAPALLTRGNRTAMTEWLFARGAAAGGKTAVTTAITYDQAGNVVAVRHPTGQTTSIDYDATHTFPVTLRNALGHAIQFSYYGAGAIGEGSYGQLASISDANGNRWTATYDTFGRQALLTAPSGSYDRYSYVAFGDLQEQRVVVDHSGILLSASYFDGAGREWKQVETGWKGREAIRLSRYDNRGLIAETSLPFFFGGPMLFTQFKYDSLGRETERTRPDGVSRRACHTGWSSVFIDENGHARRELYDADAKPTDVTTYVGTFAACSDTAGAQPLAEFHVDYSVFGETERIIDPSGNAAAFALDSMGRLSERSDTNSGTTLFAYDASGNLTRIAKLGGVVTTRTFDAIDRLTREETTEPGHQPIIAAYTYDQNNQLGLLTDIADESGGTHLVYDEMQRVVATERKIGRRRFMERVTYDPIGRLASYSYPDGNIVQYSYSGPVLQAIADARRTYATFDEYNAAGQALRTTYGNGVTTIAQYVPATLRLDTTSTTGPHGGIMSLQYGYDRAGNITALTDRLQQVTQQYAYDELNRITAMSDGRRVVKFSYDAAGNVTFNSLLGNYMYPAPSGGPANGVVHAGANQFAYDARGNMRSGAGRALVYDGRDFLVGVRQRGSATLAPNAPVRRVRRLASNTHLAYDWRGVRVLESVNGVATIRVSDRYQCTGKACQKWIVGNEPIAKIDGSAVRFVHSDHQQSTRTVTDGASGGRIKGDVNYLPFGTAETDGETTRRRFVGSWIDEYTGLYQFGLRYYDPLLGRFLSPDPLQVAGSSSEALNRYSYARNNPLRLTDRHGLRADDEDEPDDNGDSGRDEDGSRGNNGSQQGDHETHERPEESNREFIESLTPDEIAATLKEIESGGISNENGHVQITSVVRNETQPPPARSHEPRSHESDAPTVEQEGLRFACPECYIVAAVGTALLAARVAPVVGRLLLPTLARYVIESGAGRPTMLFRLSEPAIVEQMAPPAEQPTGFFGNNPGGKGGTMTDLPGGPDAGWNLFQQFSRFGKGFEFKGPTGSGRGLRFQTNDGRFSLRMEPGKTNVEVTRPNGPSENIHYRPEGGEQ